MKKVFIIYFYVIFLLFSLISPFVFITSNLDNFNKVNSNFLYSENLKSNDIFKDWNYKEASEYDFQSSLMLRQDYFMQGLDLSNYAFSFGVETPFISNVSADKNDDNYWFNKIKNSAWNYRLSWNLANSSKSSVGRLIVDYQMSTKLLNIFVYKNDVKYEFTFNWEIIPYLFMPIIGNQSYRHFDINYLVLNFNYKKIINMDILKKSESNYYINDVKQNFYLLDNLFQILDYFYSNVLRTIFDISNFKEQIYFSSDNGNLGFVFFIKNGFLLYPKSMLFNILRFPDTVSGYLEPQVQLYNAYTINNTNDYFSYYSNWDYKTDVLPSNNDKYTQSIKLLDMADNSKYQGFNLIRFNTTRLTEKIGIAILGFNFSIYNAMDWNDEINAGDIWKLPYSSCTWYNVFCHIKNGFIWAFNTLPGIKEVGKYANALVNTMQNVNLLWDNISNFFAFDIAFKLLLGAIITLAMFNGILRFL
ncbi:spiroplasma phage ORF1-like family protein [Spiroplasma endosymbiont of Glossina fuscipes fuscipes]|uniref:spiroplasma phage ORF1-like family protein n=1 Tax=Spiroplasma endosymbiont of Glossina fuscipes fuscipes TaxID=2004463 RepID=UPI003C76B27B